MSFSPTITFSILFASIYTLIGLVILIVASGLPRIGWYKVLRPVAYFHFGLGLLCLFAVIIFSNDAYGGLNCVMLENSTRTVYSYGDNFTGAHWDYESTPPSCAPNNLDCVKLFHRNITTTFVNSCDGLTPPGFFSSMTQVFIWFVGFEALILLLAPLWMAANILKRVPP